MFIMTSHIRNVCDLFTNSEISFNVYIMIEKVLNIINKLLNEKTTKSDEIFNEIFKKLVFEINIDLIQKIRKIFVNDSLLTRYKKSITIILYKENKKDYFLFKSYKLIVFENTLIKVVKCVVLRW